MSVSIARIGAIASKISLPIDVGSAAINGATTASSGTTKINKQNPANASGYINEIQLYVGTALTECYVGVFYLNSSNVFTARASYYIGSAATGLNTVSYNHMLRIYAGDYIGIYYATGALKADISTGEGYWYLSGNQTACSNATFTLYSTDNFALSLYGTGLT